MLTFNEKEILFIAAICAGNNGAASACIAGYSAASAKVAASRLNATPKIIEGLILYRKDPSNDCFKIYPKKAKNKKPIKKDAEPVITPVTRLPTIATVIDEQKTVKQAPPIDGGFVLGFDTTSPLNFLKSVWCSEDLDIRQRTEAAKAALPYVHSKKADIGKKEQEALNAGAAMSQFQTATPPSHMVAT
jgi:phage terminase small subunit